jgi:hypothetical protein
MTHSHQRAHQQALETYANFVVCSLIGGRCYLSKSQKELGRKCSTRAYYSNNINWCMKSAFMCHTRVVTRVVTLTSSSATLLQQTRLLSPHPPAHISYLSHFSAPSFRPPPPFSRNSAASADNACRHSLHHCQSQMGSGDTLIKCVRAHTQGGRGERESSAQVSTLALNTCLGARVFSRAMQLVIQSTVTRQAAVGANTSGLALWSLSFVSAPPIFCFPFVAPPFLLSAFPRAFLSSLLHILKNSVVYFW